MIICDECGRKNDDDYKFCLGCGSPLSAGEEPEQEDSGPDMVTCPFCGAEQPSNFKFCGSCGEEIPEDAEAVGADDAADQQESAGPEGAGEPAAAEEADESTPGVAPGVGSEERSTHPGGPAAASVKDGVARLVVIRPDGTEGAAIEIPADSLTLGRDSNVEALSSDPFLSPSHATIVPGDGTFLLRDEDSVNGIFREVRDSVELSDGDQIRVGQELLEFEFFADGDSQAEDIRRAGSPDPGYWGRLSVVAGPDIRSEAYALRDREITIGREAGDIVFRDDGFVSGSHARLLHEDDGTVVLEDLNSSNGTFVRIRDNYTMQPGERVLMGQQLFRLEV